MSHRFLALASLLAALLQLPVAAWGQDNCILCHYRRTEPDLSAPVEEQAQSAHGDAEMSCADCHGGRREENTVRAHDPDSGFVGRPSPEEIPETCGGCHSDEERMGEANARFPTDQLRLYRRSGHGSALAQGNGDVATCISCHGTHSVAHAGDPESLIHRDNIAPTCGGCHSDPEAMTDSGMPLNQMRRWRRSVHGRAFVDEEDDEAPTCASCHDAHGGITGLDDVASCGRCHEQQEETFRQSPHATVFERLGFAGCIECHGSHDVRPAHARLIGTMQSSSCRRCHNEGQPVVFETIRRLGELRTAAELAARRGRNVLSHLSPDERASPTVLEIQALFEEAERELSVGIHSFDEAGVERGVRTMTDAASLAVGLERGSGDKVWGEANLLLLILLSAIVIITVVAGVLYRRRR